MREDMAKVIVERPRYRGGAKPPLLARWKCVDWDEQPRQIGLKKQWSRQEKSLNENLAPLRRFLQSRVGRLWIDVEAEMRERINIHSAVQLHIWQHVEEFVQTRPHEKFSWNISPFCVDTATGKLCTNPEYGRWGRKHAPAPTVVARGSNGQFRRIQGIWRNLIFKPLPREWERAWDAYFKTHLRRVGLKRLVETYGRAGVYAVAVLPPTPRQLKGLPR